MRVGDTLVTLTTSTARSDVEGRRARVAAAEAQLRDLQAGARTAEVQRARAELASADAEAEHAQREVTRLTPLATSGTVSKQQLDEARTLAATAAAHRAASREALTLVQQGSRPERIRGAEAEVVSARAALVAADQAAADLVLVAHSAGTIVSRNVEAGEVLTTGTPAMTLADTRRPYVRIYLGPASLSLVKVGATATAAIDAFPGRTFTGRVAAISSRAEFTPRVALTEEERADLLYAVRVEFDDTSGMLKAGLPVTVRITRGTELAGSQPAARK